MPTQVRISAPRLQKMRFRAPVIFGLAMLAWLPIAALLVAWLGL